MVKIRDVIKEKIDNFKGTPIKVLLPFKIYQKIIEEEKLISGFCTKHHLFLGYGNLYCFKCKSEINSIIKDMPIIEIYGLPFEVTSNTKEVKII